MHRLGALQELHLAQVTGNQDPEGRGRLKVRLHSLEVEVWAGCLTPSAGRGYGVSLLPRVGEQVVLGFLSPELPVVLGALWSGGSSQPEDGRPVEDRYLVRTPAGTRILADDGNSPKLVLQTPAGFHLTIDEGAGGSITVEKGGEKIELSNSGIRIQTASRVEIQAGQVNVSAGMVQVDAGMSRFSGVVQCDTLITNAVVSSSYTPGAGNVW
ncbi:MAG: phage baseplate assembly protein V [Thermodesulfobacteriota bacterium]